MAQIGAGRAFRAVGPQHFRQGFAAVRATGLVGQIGQQGAGLERFKTGDRFAVQGHLKWPQQANVQAGHATTIPCISPLRRGAEAMLAGCGLT